MDPVQDSKRSLHFEDYKNTLCKNLIRYFNRKSFINVTIICNGETFMAHQVVLSACSNFFENVLSSRTESHPIIVFADIPKDHMELLLTFMYYGKISVSEKLLPLLLKSAKKLQIRGLNYNKFDNAQTNLERENLEGTTQNLFPVSIETIQHNNTVQEGENIEAQRSVDKEKSRWLTSKNETAKIEEPGKKVINPFAVQQKSFSDSDSTIFDYDAPGSSKNNSSNHPLKTVFSPLNNDSDVEFIENDMSIVVIPDTQHNYDVNRKVQKRSRPENDSYRFNEVEFTSDESEIIRTTPKKAKRNTVVGNSESESDLTLSALLNPAALKGARKDKSNNKIVKEISGSSKTSKNKYDALDTIQNDKSEPGQSKTKPTVNGDDGSTSSKKNMEEPIEGYLDILFPKLRNFCVICKKYKRHCRRHIKERHNVPSRGKRFTCKICSKKFGREKSLELHKCEQGTIATNSK